MPDDTTKAGTANGKPATKAPTANVPVKTGNAAVDKYASEIAQLLPLLGGKENVSSALNCVSRLRLVIKDMKMVKDKEIGKLPSSRGTIKLPGNQYHVVIGPDVPNYFKAFQAFTGMAEASAVTLKGDAAKRGGKVQWVMQNFSEIFIPIIPVLVAAGLILGVRNLFEADFDGFVMTEWSPVVKGLNDFLWIPAQAGLWFLPVYICWSVFKKMGGSQILGILIGLSMLIDPLQNIYAVSGASGASVQWIWDLDLSKLGFDFGSWQFPWKISYTAQVIPALLVGFAGVYIERFLNRHTTAVLKQIIVPLVTVIVSYVLAMCAIGPIGWTAGTAISFGVSWALTNEIARYIFAPIFGFLYAPLVVTGLHHTLNAVMAQDVAQTGGTILFPILCMSNIAQGATAGLMGVIQRKNTKVKSITMSSTASAWLGVTEPAMYGINTRFGAPFVGAIVGSAAGSLFIAAFGVSAAGIGNGAWLGALSIQVSSPIDGYTTVANAGQAWFIIGGLVAVAVSCGLTVILRRVPRFKKLEIANAIEDYPHDQRPVKEKNGMDVAMRWLPGSAAVAIFIIGFAAVVNTQFAAAAGTITSSGLGNQGHAFAFVASATLMLLALPLMFSGVLYAKVKKRGYRVTRAEFITVTVAVLVLLAVAIAAVAVGYAV